MDEPGGVSVVVLAKDSNKAKTRLGLSPDLARRTALALSSRTVRAARAARGVGTVLVVTSDPLIAQNAREAGAQVVDEGIAPVGMNPAAELGRRQALALRPRAAVAVMVADLPYLEPDDLSGIVAEYQEERRSLFVPDCCGDGTTFLIHASADLATISFGPRSAEAHRRLGFASARLATNGLRRDLDTVADLAAVRANPPPSPKLPSGTAGLMTT